MSEMIQKDYFTEKEAAFYCGVSLNHFRKNTNKFNISVGVFMGKKLYRVNDLRRAIESEFTILSVPK